MLCCGAKSNVSKSRSLQPFWSPAGSSTHHLNLAAVSNPFLGRKEQDFCPPVSICKANPAPTPCCTKNSICV